MTSQPMNGKFKSTHSRYVMKKICIFGMMSAMLLSVSCSEKDEFLGLVPAATQGDEVQFTFGDSKRSRTMYQDDWDAKTNQELYWGNYLDILGKDQVKIFCYQAARQIASYEVTAQTDNSNVAQSIEKLGSYGIQWGKEGVDHNFYAFYPASAAGNAFLDNEGKVIRATVGVGQSPVTYKAVFGGNTYTNNALQNVNDNKTQSVDNAATIYGQPDMSAAIMVAKTTVSGTPNESNQSGYGYPVPLHFNVLADVLDITVNGPVIPNTLGGNEAEVGRDYIQINSVTIQSIDGKTPISGDFDLDMSTGKASNVSGNTSIQLQTAQVTSTATLRPTLYARVDTESTPAADELDHLRLRAFLIPGQITNLNQLKVVISTDCGEYTQVLGDDAMVTGTIHPIKMGYFKKRGTDFDFTRWMSQLDPTIYVSELSLPGTWHSTASDFQGSSYNNFETQYKAGVRAFELHARNTATYSNVTYGAYTDAQDPVTNVTSSNGTISRTGTGTTGSCSRTVTYTKTVTTTRTAPVTGYTLNHQLLNYQNSNDLASALPGVQNLIQGSAFALFEIGMEGQAPINVPESMTQSSIETSTATVTQTGTWRRNNQWSSNYTYTWNEVTAPTDDQYGTPTTSTSEKAVETTIDASEAWAMAVSQIVTDLANQGVVYADKITPNTTISDVAGKIIIKVNTNDDSNEKSGWQTDTPALFSRWVNGSASTPLTVGLNWGQPASTTVADNPMRWCFTELDNIGSSLDGRKSAVDAMNSLSVANYKTGNHDTWYECQIGGYLNSSLSAANCQAVAKEMNPYLIQVLSNPNREACPLGLIYMNYALDDTYSGPELIRTIINNNSAFILNRAGATATNAADRTNSSVEVASGNALK